MAEEYGRTRRGNDGEIYLEANGLSARRAAILKQYRTSFTEGDWKLAGRDKVP